MKSKGKRDAASPLAEPSFRNEALAERLRQLGLVPPDAPAPASPAGSAAEARPAAGDVVPAAQPGREAAPQPVDLSGSGKLVLRRERQGRGGKTVTVVEGLTLPAAALEDLARLLRRSFGVGCAVEEGRLVLQGDQTQRLIGWLEGHGARKVVRGS